MNAVARCSRPKPDEGLSHLGPTEAHMPFIEKAE